MAHLTLSEISRLLRSQDAEELERAIPHLMHCRDCYDLAAFTATSAEFSQAGRAGGPRSALLQVFEAERRQEVARLRAKARWSELSELTPPQQAARIRESLMLQTRPVFEVALEEARALAQADPFLGEQTALVARVIAALAPVAEELRQDLQCEALLVAGNCRRIAANLTGAEQTLQAARAHHGKGSGSANLEARLCSVEAALATDRGELAAAQKTLTRAAELFRGDRDWAGLACVAVQLANGYLATARWEAAVEAAQEALRALEPAANGELEMLARMIVIECLAALGRADEALRALIAAGPLFARFPSERTRLNVAYLEARVLDGLGHPQEAEKLFRRAIKGTRDLRLYKDTFLTLLTLLESFYARGEVARALALCDEAAAMMEEMDARAGDARVRALWPHLRQHIALKSLTPAMLAQSRAQVATGQSGPAPQFAEDFRLPDHDAEPPALLNGAEDEEDAGRTGAADFSAILSEALAGGIFREAKSTLERRLIVEALDECGGQIKPAARRLKMARNTLRKKMKDYGLGNP